MLFLRARILEGGSTVMGLYTSAKTKLAVEAEYMAADARPLSSDASLLAGELEAKKPLPWHTTSKKKYCDFYLCCFQVRKTLQQLTIIVFQQFITSSLMPILFYFIALKDY